MADTKNKGEQTGAFSIPEYVDPASDRHWPSLDRIVLGAAQLDALQVEPAALRAFRVPDNAMLPLSPGACVIFDTSDTIPADGHVYLIRHPRTGAILRRVFVGVDGSLILRPDFISPLYREEWINQERAPTLRVVGRALLALVGVT